MAEPVGVIHAHCEVMKKFGVAHLKNGEIEIWLAGALPEAGNLGDKPLSPEEQKEQDERMLFYSADNQ